MSNLYVTGSCTNYCKPGTKFENLNSTEHIPVISIKTKKMKRKRSSIRMTVSVEHSKRWDQSTTRYKEGQYNPYSYW